MSMMKDMASVAVLIGDVVGSREIKPRSRLHERLRAVLDEVNDTTAPLQPLRITVGDEFQGAYADLGTAVAATLTLRLALLPLADLRHGIGWGPVEVLQQQPRVEDGPGWWAAREAIEAVKRDQQTPALRGVRTAVRHADGQTAAATNAALMLRDDRVSGLSVRSRTLLAGLVAGRSQAELAAEEGISASAISQRVRNDGLGVLVASHRLWTDEEEKR